MKVKINTELLELFLYYWQATADREKVSDIFLGDLSSRPELSVLYNDEFGKDSVRKVLSAITNREILSEKTLAEGRFWNNNMWMLEDLGVTMEMLAPVKQLNGEQFESLVEEETVVTFIPGHLDTYYRKGPDLFINFFKLAINYGTGAVEIEGRSLPDFISYLLKG